MPHWVKPYKIRRSVRVLTFGVQQNYTLLETGGESCFLLKRMRRANDQFQNAARRVDYIETATIPASAFTLDPDVGMYSYEMWNSAVNRPEVFPDIGAFTATVSASGGSATVWEQAVDKYSFVAGRSEYAFDLFQHQLDVNGNPLADAVWVVFNTPPFGPYYQARLKYGTINPTTDFAALQPEIETQPGFQNSLFSFRQWLSGSPRIRTRAAPNRFLLAFPGVLTDITLNEAGFLRQSQADYWTTPAPYSPVVVEHDVVVRESTGQRYQVTNYTPVYLEDVLVSQHFDMVELDPRSSVYSVPVAR